MKISICIPTYEQPELLAKALDSILCQTYQEFEIVISDDSVSNSVVDLIAERYRGDSRIRFFRNESPLGSPANWNLAIERCSGEIVKILHHDDFFIENRALELFSECFKRNPAATMVACSSRTYDPKGNPWGFTILTPTLRESIARDPLRLFQGNLIGAPSVVAFRKRLGLKFDERLKWLVDLDFYIASLHKGAEIHFLEEPLVGITILDPNRVTAISERNGYVEVFEHLVLFDKVLSLAGVRLRPFLQLWMIFDRYDVKNQIDLKFFQISEAYIGAEIKKILIARRIFSKLVHCMQIINKLLSPTSLARFAITRTTFLMSRITYRN